MKKIKPKQRKVVRISWYLECPECAKNGIKKEIKGNYEEQAIRNLNSHLEKHRRKNVQTK